MKILLTGFVPFGSVKVNPSELIVKQVAQRGCFPELVTEVMPVEYQYVRARLAELIREHEPDAVVCVGVAESRKAINLERVALNVNDASIPDNVGDHATGRVIEENAPAAYWSTLPLEQMRTTLETRSIPVAISNHAGAYLCNHAFYVARHTLEGLNRPIPCGFIHVPALCEAGAADCQGLPLEVMVEGIEACLECLMVGE